MVEQSAQHIDWRNWSGSQKARFQGGFRPSSEVELKKLVQKAFERKQPIKCVGSSHSFSHLIADDRSHLVSLENFKGIEKIDTQRNTVTVRAGTTIKELSRLLWNEGWAIENLGDIEEQTLAGAISTGTHGTGINFQNLAGFVQSLRLHSPARGVEEFFCQMPEFRDLAIGTFAFGVVSHYDLSVVPRYYLKLNMFPSTLEEFKRCCHEWVSSNRNAEIFWFPGTESTLVKLTNETPSMPQDNRQSEFVATYIENKLFGWLCKINKNFRYSYPILLKLIARFLPRSQKVDRSYKVYATARHVRFQETEYSLPLSRIWEVVAQMENLLAERKYHVLFPIEFRFVKKDSISLSPSFGDEDRVYIAVHSYYQDSFYQSYFKEMEQIFLRVGGRPHWGKMFSATKSDFHAMYPDLERVNKLRMTFDPDNLLLTSTLKDSVFR